MWVIKLSNVEQVDNSRHQGNPHKNNVIIRKIVIYTSLHTTLHP